MDNIFFDPLRLRACGKNVIIGVTARIRYPELVSIGDNCIIDDFCYISTQLTLAGNNHVTSGCKIIGGRKAEVSFGEFAGISPNVTLVAGSDDYVGGISSPVTDEEFKGDCVVGAIRVGKLSIVGANSVVLPNVTIGEGATVGALSLVNRDLAPWTLYAGIPVREIKKRNREQVQRFEREWRQKHGQRD